LKRKLGLASALFTHVQLRLLGLLFGHPEHEFHASEIIRRVKSGSGAVQRELQKLALAGIITARRAANRKLYQANKQSPIFAELRSLIVKTIGVVDPLRDALKKLHPKIRCAFIYGSVAKGTDTARSDIDVMIVGDDLAYSEIFEALQRAERTLDRLVNPNLMTAAEWTKKLSDSAFVRKVADQPKLFLIGSDDELERTGQPRRARRP
jgi:predicted nucleotidyltransferase